MLPNSDQEEKSDDGSNNKNKTENLGSSQRVWIKFYEQASKFAAEEA